MRFTRGVPVEGKKDLAPVMVRRLKRDLRKLGFETFPRRMLVELGLRHEGGAWSVVESAYDAEVGTVGPARTSSLGPAKATEIELAEKLARYTELCAPASGQGRLAFVMLQQRLLSSPEAFARTLGAHLQGVEKRGGPIAAPQQGKLHLPAEPPRKTSAALEEDPETHGASDEAMAEESDAEVRRASEALSPSDEARGLLTDLRGLAERARRTPDAKALAFLAWLRENVCPAVGLAADAKADRAWKPRRVILFTEYADTKRWWVELLTAAVTDTERGDQRILQFHGGMGDETRDEVQRAFNSPPEEHPVRILVATDAAREGVNLQAHCADLFHLDIPWNPSRLEQRNGRIDRTLQPAEEVRCHYFVYPQRPEDQVLETVIRKVTTVQRELGSLGAVLLGQVEKALEGGITKKTRQVIEKVGEGVKATTVDDELEDQRKDLEAVRAEVELAGRRLDASRKTLEVDPDSLRGVVSIGLAMAGATNLTPLAPTSDGRPTYALPTLDRSWEATLDTLRPPRGRSEPFYEWRQKAPRAVTFHPLTRLSEDAEQLHLAHPFVKRILDRFLAQGFGAHDLSRVTAVIAPDESVIRVVAYARLTLFGPGAARLHDQLVAIAAPWSGDASEVAPYKDRATTVGAIAQAERLLASGARAPNAIITKRIRENTGALYRALWPALEAEADALQVDARLGLGQRARRESDQMRTLLARQSVAIDKAELRLRQADLFDIQDKDQKRQVEADLKHLERRRGDAAAEAESEPAAIEALYDVRMERVTPIGMVVAWPELMT